MKVLIAEDDEVSRFLMERLLQKMGHDTTTARDGLEGLEAFKNNSFDMAILDWMMPEMDGIALCKEIRGIERTADKPLFIFMVTAKSDPKDMLYALASGVDDFLTKPVDRKLLEQRILMGMKYQHFLEMKNETKMEPSLIITEEHDIFRQLIHILDVIYDNLETGVTQDILEWLTRTLSKLALEIHQDKEDLYLRSFIGAVTSEHVDWFSDLSESSFLTLTEDHDMMESMLMEIQGHVSKYLPAQKVQSEPLKQSLKSYSDLLLKHIHMEEKVFFPFAEKYLLPEDKNELVSLFRSIDKAMGVEAITRARKEITEILELITESEDIVLNWRPDYDIAGCGRQ